MAVTGHDKAYTTAFTIPVVRAKSVVHQLLLLPASPPGQHTTKGGHRQQVAGEKHEGSPIHHKLKMADGEEGSQ